MKESTCCNRLYCRSNAFWKGGLQSRQYSTPCFFAASMLDQQIKISFAFYFCFVLFLQRAFCLDIFCFFNVALPQEVLAMANANSKIKTNTYCIVKEKGINLGLSKKNQETKIHTTNKKWRRCLFLVSLFLICFLLFFASAILSDLPEGWSVARLRSEGVVVVRQSSFRIRLVTVISLHPAIVVFWSGDGNSSSLCRLHVHPLLQSAVVRRVFGHCW